MQLGSRADGALLQRALEGEQVDSPATAPLVAVAREVALLAQSGLAPRSEFVATLRQRLLDAPVATESRPPAVVHVGRRLRLAAAAVGILLLLATSLGIASRSAVPGDRLYPVKQLIDRVVLDVQRDRVGLGLTLLSQSTEHVAEAQQLVAVAPAREADLVAALDAATASAGEGHDVLLDAYRTERRGDALTGLDAFYAQTEPIVDALPDGPLPAAVAAAWTRLHDVLEQGRDDTLHVLATCSLCGDAAGRAQALLDALPLPDAADPLLPGGPLSTLPGGRSATAGATGTPGASGTATRGHGASATGSHSGAGGAAPLPSKPGGVVRPPSVVITGTGNPGGGGGVTLPGPLPTLSLPTVTINTSGVTIGGGGVTLPGATVPLPSVTVPLPSVTLPLPEVTLPRVLP